MGGVRRSFGVWGLGAFPNGCEGLRWPEEVGSPTRRAGKGWEVLQENREGSRGLGKVKSFFWWAGRGWVALLEAWEG